MSHRENLGADLNFLPVVSIYMLAILSVFRQKELYLQS